MLTAMTITLEPSTESLRAARTACADALAAAGVALPEVERVVLALSELATNALQHGPAAQIRLEVEVEGDEIELSVAQLADGRTIPDPESWRLPDNPTQPTGRGLAIVAAVSDTVEVVADGDIIEIRARFVPRSDQAHRTGG